MEQIMFCTLLACTPVLTSQQALAVLVIAIVVVLIKVVFSISDSVVDTVVDALARRFSNDSSQREGDAS
jgi:hypothetical protein